ncbi:XRE family transcriptional regulator [Mucilaginibacter conchicola]|uniref:XRE family transcriptional regulator n=1 Tax=Mucilaginibacter conchicola TaxID=2303333 RepID=A0A372NLS8_9SPHI|nr:helix-turn-helix transcriptional regulator [Mucilaginibacter conchicola]RFZ89912.1 XRE family transcriptional regulator [Mucilaginibacter conchicola]
MSETLHIGRKISRIRELRGMKQEALATELGISQQAVSKIEQSEKIEEEVLEKIATALGVSSEAISKFNEDVLVFHIQNMHDHSTAYQYNYQCTFNPIDRLVEVYEENKKLYEQLLASEREKVEILKSK